MGVEMKECRLPFRGDENVLKLTIAEVRELCGDTKRHRLYRCRQ